MKNTNIVITGNQASYIIDIIDAMDDRCDPYLSHIVRRTFAENARKLQSNDIQEAIESIIERGSIDEQFY